MEERLVSTHFSCMFPDGVTHACRLQVLIAIPVCLFADDVTGMHEKAIITSSVNLSGIQTASTNTAAG
jgi:hypothetical protein